MAAASAGSSLPAQQQYQQQSHGPGGGGAVAGPSVVGMSSCGGTLATVPLGQIHGAGSAAAAGRQFLGKVSGSGQGSSGIGLVTAVQQVQQNNPSQKQQLQQPSSHPPPHHIASNTVLQQQHQANQPNLVSGWKRALSNGDIVYLR